MVLLNLIVLLLTLDVSWLFHEAKNITPTSQHLSYEKCDTIERMAPNPCSSVAFLKYCASRCRGKMQRKLQCYLKTNEKEISRRIVGGEDSVEGQWPWHVSLRINDKQWCSGSIITNRYILTAAHCFDSKHTSINASDWQVLTGDHLLSTKDSKEVAHQVKKIVIHNKFRVVFYNKRNGMFGVGFNDIALLELETPISSTLIRSGGFLCLPDESDLAREGDLCRIVGWGHQTFIDGKQPEILQNAQIPIVSNAICNQPNAYNGRINEENTLCAGYPLGKIDACIFDSGGALACQKKGSWFATGIISSGFECGAAHSYGLYSNVVNYKNWIIETILRN